MFRKPNLDRRPPSSNVFKNVTRRGLAQLEQYETYVVRPSVLLHDFMFRRMTLFDESTRDGATYISIVVQLMHGAMAGPEYGNFFGEDGRPISPYAPDEKNERECHLIAAALYAQVLMGTLRSIAYVLLYYKKDAGTLGALSHTYELIQRAFGNSVQDAMEWHLSASHRGTLQLFDMMQDETGELSQISTIAREYYHVVTLRYRRFLVQSVEHDKNKHARIKHLIHGAWEAKDYLNQTKYELYALKYNEFAALFGTMIIEKLDEQQSFDELFESCNVFVAEKSAYKRWWFNPLYDVDWQETIGEKLAYTMRCAQHVDARVQQFM